MDLKEYNIQETSLSTGCNAQTSYLVHLVWCGKIRRITFSNSECRRQSSPVGKYFGGSRGGTNSRKLWNKDGIHRRVFPLPSMTSACRWGMECSDVLPRRRAEGSVVGTARGRTVPWAIYVGTSAITHMFVVALVKMSTGEGGSGRIIHNLTLITP